MSIQTQYLNTRDAATVARALRAAGYNVKNADCHEYVANVVRHAAGADPDAQREVLSIIRREWENKYNTSDTCTLDFAECAHTAHF